MTVKKTLLTLSVTGFACTAMAGLAALYGASEMNTAAKHLAAAGIVQKHVMEADMAHDAVRASVLEARLATSPEAAREASARLATQSESLRAAIAVAGRSTKEAEVLKALAGLDAPVAEYLAQAARTATFGNATTPEAVQSTETFNRIFDGLAEKMEAASDEVARFAKTDEDDANASLQSARVQMISIAALGLALLTTLGTWLSRSTAKLLGTGIESLTSASERVSQLAAQVGEASGSLASAGQQQAASIEETSAATQELNAMAKRNMEESGHATDLLAGLDKDMVRTADAMTAMTGGMQRISQSSAKVQHILKVIDEIAFQTNILALNAAVEAARAGEAGLGFSVVAGEVRALAQRCAQASKDTAELIDHSMTATRDGEATMTTIRDLMEAVAESSRSVGEIVQNVSAGSREQAAGVDSIMRSLVELENAAQRTAAGAEESSAVGEEMACQARDLLSTVGSLRKLT